VQWWGIGPDTLGLKCDKQGPVCDTHEGSMSCPHSSDQRLGDSQGEVWTVRWGEEWSDQDTVSMCRLTAERASKVLHKGA
jgi:hypothetical protein